MHRNYYTFERQVTYLNQHFSEAIISDCYSHRKNELVLEIENEKLNLLRIGIDPQQPYLLKYSYQNIKDPKVRFFIQLKSQYIKSFRIIPFDKTVIITCSKNQIEITFYGKNANISLLDSDDRSIERFKKRDNSSIGTSKKTTIRPDNQD